MAKAMWGKEWIKLPSGSYLHRADLAKWEGKGCPKCGETVFNIYQSGNGVACPNCVWKRDGILYGKFDMVAMRVTKIFQVNEGKDEPE